MQEAKEHVGERLGYQVSMSGELTDTIMYQDHKSDRVGVQVSYVPYEGHIIASRGANEEARWKARYSDERMQRRISARYASCSNAIVDSRGLQVTHLSVGMQVAADEPQHLDGGTPDWCPPRDQGDQTRFRGAAGGGLRVLGVLPDSGCIPGRGTQLRATAVGCSGAEQV